MGGGSASGSNISWAVYLEKEQKYGLQKLRPKFDKLIDGNAPKRKEFNAYSMFGKPSGQVFDYFDDLEDFDVASKFEDALEDTNIYPEDYAEQVQRQRHVWNAWIHGHSEAPFDAILDAITERLKEEVDTEVLPRYEAGMRDLNSGMSFAYTWNRAQIWKEYTRVLAENDANLRWQNHLQKQNQRAQVLSTYVGEQHVSLGIETLNAEIAMRLASMQLQYHEDVVKIADGVFTDAANFGIKQAAIETEGRIKDALWNVEAVKYWNETIASISGAVPIRSADEMGTTRAIAGGAMGGYAAGSQTGHPWAGALLGGFMGYLGS